MGSGPSKKNEQDATLKRGTTVIPNQDAINYIYDDDVIDTVNVINAISKGDLSSNIELFVSCENLPKMDAFSLTDPMVACFQEKEGQWVLIGISEVIPETLDPKFVKTFVVQYNYKLDSSARLKFEVYDVEEYDTSYQLDKQEFVAQAEFDIQEIVTAHNNTVVKSLLIGKKAVKKRNCQIHVRGIEFDIGANKTMFKLAFANFLAKGDIRMKIYYMTDSKDWIPVYQTDPEKGKKKEFVEWKEFQLSRSKFGNDENAQLKIEVEEFSKTKAQNILGEIEITLQQMMDQSGKTLQLTKNGLKTGQIKLIEVKQNSRFTFLNYIFSGAKIHMMLAVDFTNSNKSPDDSQSLHCLTPQPNQSPPSGGYTSAQAPNDYVLAMRHILGFMQHFSNENKISMFGFGAKLPPFYNIVSHCFSCTGNIFDPFLYGGIEEVVQTYQDTLQAIKLHGPTVLSQVIEQAIFHAKNEKVDQNNLKYFILLILTDGTIFDMQATIDQLYKAENVPLSVVIIGIGDEDFSQMKILDAADNPLFSKTYNQPLKRDLVQFIQFNKHKNNYERLMKEVLAEIPKQFLYFMELSKVYPPKGKKTGKAATTEYVHQKIEEIKKAKKKEGHNNKIPTFLRKKQEEFIQNLISLGYNAELVTQIVTDGIPTMDTNLVIEMMTEITQSRKTKSNYDHINKIGYRNDIDQSVLRNLRNDEDRVGHRVFRVRVHNKLDQMLQMKKEETHQITKKFLVSMGPYKPKPKQSEETNSITTPVGSLQTIDLRRSMQYMKKKNKSPEKSRVTNEQQRYFKQALEAPELDQFRLDENLCLFCHERHIQLVFMPCGHACTCQQCHEEERFDRCLSCKQHIQMYAQISSF